jgi:hypothetical protein
MRGKEYLFTLAVDAGTFGILWLLFSWLSDMIKKKSMALPATILTPEQAQQMLMTAPEQLSQYVMQVKSFLVFSAIGAVLLIIVTFLLISLSRTLLWNKLLNKTLSLRRYGKWMLLHLTLLIPLLGFFVFYVVIKLGGAVIFALLTKNVSLFSFIQGLLDLTFFIVSMNYLFLSYMHFTRTHRIWKSIGAPFAMMNKNILTGMGFQLVTMVVISLLFLPLKDYFFIYPDRQLYVMGVLLLLYISWLRLYVVSIASKEHFLSSFS